MDFFKNPGGFSKDMIDTWHQDLVQNGVTKLDTSGNPTGGRLPVCAYDKKNDRETFHVFALRFAKT